MLHVYGPTMENTNTEAENETETEMKYGENMRNCQHKVEIM